MTSTDHLSALGYVDPLEEAAQRADQERRQRSAIASAEAYLADGRFEDAAAILKQVQSAAPHWTAPRRLLARAEFGMGRLAAAIEHLNWLEEHGVEQAELALLRAAVELRRRRFDDAIASAEYAAALQVPCPAADLLIGQVALRRGDAEAAAARFDAALAVDPNRWDALAGLAAAALRRREWDEAADWALRALDGDPTNAAIHYSLALALAGMDRLPAAAQAFQNAAALAPQRAGPWRWLAHCARRTGNLAAAAEHDRQAREIVRARRASRTNGRLVQST